MYFICATTFLGYLLQCVLCGLKTPTMEREFRISTHLTLVCFAHCTVNEWCMLCLILELLQVSFCYL